MDRVENEKKGAERIFSILSSGMAEKLIGLWEEFEKKKTPEAKFAGHWTGLNHCCRTTTQVVMHGKNTVSSGHKLKKNNMTIEQGASVNS